MNRFAIARHMYQLATIFPRLNEHIAAYGPANVYKRLLRLENEAHLFCERTCNENVTNPTLHLDNLLGP